MSNEEYWIYHELKRRIDLAYEEGADDEYAVIFLFKYSLQYYEFI